MRAAPVTRLLVLRHGQSEWNAQARWQGHADIPLDDEGLRQAGQAAERVLALGGFDAVWSSDLQRARVTAEVIAGALGLDEVHVDVRLRENDVGPWEGLNQAEVDAGWPGYLAERRRPEGFESYDAAASRMLAALRDIARHAPGGLVIVVGHGGITRAARRALGAADGHLPNLGGCWFEVDAAGDVSAGEIVVLRDRRPPASPADRSAASGVL
jgi:broad specificity phosphatase PhoE